MEARCPTIYHLQAEKFQCPRTGEDGGSQLKERDNILHFFDFFLLSGLSKDWIMLAHIGEDRTPLLSLLIQILISTGNRYNVLSTVWASLNLVKLI